MYLGEYEIDEYIDLVATTHRFSSGAAYAPSAITYRVYEDGSATEFITDTSMTNFDSVTGLYYNRIQLTAAAGFEVGKSYVVLIQATVDSVTAIDWRSFRVKFPAVNVKQIEGSDPTDTIRDAVVDDATRIDASALNTLSSHDPGAALVKVADLGTVQTGDSFAIINGDHGLVSIQDDIDAIKAKTDKMTYTSGNDLDVNIQKINDVALTGDGDATPWGPA